MTIVTELYDLHRTIEIKDEIILLPVFHGEIQGERKSLYPKDALNIFKLFNADSVPIRFSEQNQSNILYQDNRSIDWEIIVFISKAVLENKATIELIINLTIDYLNKKFIHSKETECQCSFVYEAENQQGYKKTSYTGPVSGLEELNKIIDSIKND